MKELSNQSKSVVKSKSDIRQSTERLAAISPFQRVGVFVDVQNMFYSAKRIHRGAKLNFSKLMEKAVSGRQLIRAVCYVVDNPEIDQSSFLEMLENNGYELRSKQLRHRSDGSAKADWDMGLAIDVISMADKLDVVVLVSGDGDFSELVYHLKSRGVLVEAISFLESTNIDLIQAVNRHIPIGQDMVFRSKPRKKV